MIVSYPSTGPIRTRLPKPTFDSPSGCYYRCYMKSTPLRVARIGNSRGVRIPATTLERYQIGDSVLMEERSDGILLRPPGAIVAKLSWEETAREMAAAADAWDAWEVTSGDGVEELPWGSPLRGRVAEQGSGYLKRRRNG